MAVNIEIRKNLSEGALVFDNHAYDNSIIGETFDGRVIYCFEKMVQELVEDEGCSELEAIEWIEYNAIRALPYGGEKAPIVVSCEF